MNYVMAIDQGTTGTRVILFDHNGKICANRYKEINQIFPEPGWVEHDSMEYLASLRTCIDGVLNEGFKVDEICSIGITNQRETVVLWEKNTGRPLYNAIVWQCRRSAPICERLSEAGYTEIFAEKTGLPIDAYFSATKIMWLMENVEGLRQRMNNGEVLMGTIDTWLIWNLSGGAYHVTDCSNASRTLLYNIHTKEWDDELLEITQIPKKILPEVKSSSGILAETANGIFLDSAIPIAGVAGDQHAATFGQCCFEPGMAKNTYGTALALFLNTGDKPVKSNNGLTTNLGWHIAGKTEYALEGVIFSGGAAVQWLRDGLGIIKSLSDVNMLAGKAKSSEGVYFVPAFNGLCAPYWDMYARGLIIGLTRGTSKEQIARACLESMAFQTKDVVDVMEADFGQKCSTLRVDGGASKNDILMQFQADILGIPVQRPVVTEMAAQGAAYLAGLGVGFWESKEEILEHWKVERCFEPDMSDNNREILYEGWSNAVNRSLNWVKKG